MPDRVIRDEILTSERYWSVSIEAQRLFIHLLLVVDDTARFSGKNYTIRATCFPGQSIDPAKIERQLAELQDVDLARLYQVGEERFIFVPRFKQRLRFQTSKYPVPPKEINDITSEKSDSSQTQDGLKSGSSPQKRSEEKRSEEKKNKTARKARISVDWNPSPATIERLREFWLVPEDVQRYVAAFKDTCQAKDYQYADFDAAFSNSVRQDWPKFRDNPAKSQPWKNAV